MNSSLDTLESIFKAYLAAQEEVLDYTGPASLNYETRHSVPVTAPYTEAKGLLLAALKHIGQHSPGNTTELNSFANTSSNNIIMEEKMQKLQEQVLQLQQLLITNQAQQLEQPLARPLVPRVTIPKFSGDIGEWTQFHDLFMSLIGNNERMTGAEKMYHLKGALTGEAEKF